MNELDTRPTRIKRGVALTHAENSQSGQSQVGYHGAGL